MGTAFEEIENTVWNETAAHRQKITIGMAMLMGTEKPHQVEVLPCARHNDVK
jgi:hypothetical protein